MRLLPRTPSRTPFGQNGGVNFIKEAGILIALLLLALSAMRMSP